MKTLKAALLALLIGALATAGLAWAQNVGNVPSGGNVVSSPSFTVRNSGTSATSNAYLEARVQGTGAGDPHLRLTIPGGTSWYAAVDNSASDTYIVGMGTAVGTSGVLFLDVNGNLGLGAASTATGLEQKRSVSGASNTWRNWNTANNSGANALAHMIVGGTSAGDAASVYGVSGGFDWITGVDNSVTSPEADPYVISRSTALGTSDVVRHYSDRVQLVLGAAAPGEGRWVRRAHVQTTDATVTTIATIAIGTSKIHALRTSCTSLRSTVAEGAYYERLAAYKNSAGTVTLIGAAASPITAEDTAAWDNTLAISGTDVLLRATGEAAKTIEWECVIEEVVTAAS